MLAIVVALSLGASDWACDYSQENWTKAGLDAPCKVVSPDAGPDQLASVMKRWSLDEAQARCAIEASTAPRKEAYAQENEDSERWRKCVLQWPNQKALWVGMLLATDHREAFDEPIAKLAPAPVDGGTSLAEELLQLEFGPHGQLALHVLKTQPRRLGFFLRQYPQFELSLVTLEERRATITDADWAPLGRELVSTPLQRGQFAFAGELWMQLPPAVRAELKSKPIPEVHTTFGSNGMSRTESGDLRTKLALGLVLAGQKAEAATIPIGEAPPVLKDLITFHLAGKRSIDPWEGAIAARSIRDSGEGDFFALLHPYIAPHHQLNDKSWLVERGFQEDGPRSDNSLALTRRLNDVDRKSFERMKALVIAQRPEVADAGIEAVTLPPAWSPFVEAKKPWKGKAPVPFDLGKARPRGFWPIRAEKFASRIVVLALSQRLDPVGEVSPGAYWLLVSKDGGNTWKEHYLGLGEHRPWHAREDAKVPLLDEKDVVRLVVDEAPIVESTIMFPPVATQAPTVRANVILEAKLVDVMRDSDRDGLSDLVEARLLLDPARADTDGDGSKDGDDATPRLDDRLPATPLAEIYNAFFEEGGGGRPRAHITKPNSKSALDVTPRSVQLDDVGFLIGTPAELAGLRPLKRIITLTRPELEAARKRFGDFYPDRLKVIMNGPDHAFITFSSGWAGGECRIDRDESGKLVVTMLSQWIS